MRIGGEVAAEQPRPRARRDGATSRPADCIHIGARLLRPDRKPNSPPDVLIRPTLVSRARHVRENICSLGTPMPTQRMSGLAALISATTRSSSPAK